MANGVFAAGDNSNGQLWNNKFQLSPHFVPCEKFPCDAKSITQISAWGQALAVLVGNHTVFFRTEDGDIENIDVKKIRSIACTGSTVLGLHKSGEIVDLLSGTSYSNKKFTSIAASNSIVCAIDAKERAVCWKNEEREILADDAIAVACTNSAVYVSSTRGVFAFEDGERTEILAKEPIVMIRCAEDAVLFLGKSGAVYTCEFGALSRVFGIPVIVSIAVGAQHFAALSSDGRLFTWGFNPSGQLGIGTDRSIGQPRLVLDHVTMVACGTHHTLAVKDLDRLPELLPVFEDTITQPSSNPHAILPGKCLTRAERLW